MRVGSLALLLASALTIAVSAQAQLPMPVSQGLAAVKAGDYNLAVDEWTKTWQEGEATDSSRLRLKSAFATLGASAGKPQGWDLVHDVAILPAVRRYYIIVSGARAPVYLVLEAYQRPEGTWTVEHIQFNATLTALPPADIAEFLRGP